MIHASLTQVVYEDSDVEDLSREEVDEVLHTGNVPQIKQDECNMFARRLRQDRIESTKMRSILAPADPTIDKTGIRNAVAIEVDALTRTTEISTKSSIRALQPVPDGLAPVVSSNLLFPGTPEEILESQLQFDSDDSLLSTLGFKLDHIVKSIESPSLTVVDQLRLFASRKPHVRFYFHLTHFPRHSFLLLYFHHNLLFLSPLQLFKDPSIFPLVSKCLRARGYKRGSSTLESSSLPIIIAQILYRVYQDEGEWPLEFLECFLEDSLSHRKWVDAVSTDLFCKNILAWTVSPTSRDHLSFAASALTNSNMGTMGSSNMAWMGSSVAGSRGAMSHLGKDKDIERGPNNNIPDSKGCDGDNKGGDVGSDSDSGDEEVLEEGHDQRVETIQKPPDDPINPLVLANPPPSFALAGSINNPQVIDLTRSDSGSPVVSTPAPQTTLRPSFPPVGTLQLPAGTTTTIVVDVASPIDPMPATLTQSAIPVTTLPMETTSTPRYDKSTVVYDRFSSQRKRALDTVECTLRARLGIAIDPSPALKSAVQAIVAEASQGTAPLIQTFRSLCGLASVRTLSMTVLEKWLTNAAVADHVEKLFHQLVEKLEVSSVSQDKAAVAPSLKPSTYASCAPQPVSVSSVASLDSYPVGQLVASDMAVVDQLVKLRTVLKSSQLEFYKLSLLRMMKRGVAVAQRVLEVLILDDVRTTVKHETNKLIVSLLNSFSGFIPSAQSASASTSTSITAAGFINPDDLPSAAAAATTRPQMPASSPRSVTTGTAAVSPRGSMAGPADPNRPPTSVQRASPASILLRSQILGAAIGGAFRELLCGLSGAVSDGGGPGTGSGSPREPMVATAAHWPGLLLDMAIKLVRLIGRKSLHIPGLIGCCLNSFYRPVSRPSFAAAAAAVSDVTESSGGALDSPWVVDWPILECLSDFIISLQLMCANDFIVMEKDAKDKGLVGAPGGDSVAQSASTAGGSRTGGGVGGASRGPDRSKISENARVAGLLALTGGRSSALSSSGFSAGLGGISATGASAGLMRQTAGAGVAGARGGDGTVAAPALDVAVAIPRERDGVLRLCMQVQEIVMQWMALVLTMPCGVRLLNAGPVMNPGSRCDKAGAARVVTAGSSGSGDAYDIGFVSNKLLDWIQRSCCLNSSVLTKVSDI